MTVYSEIAKRSVVLKVFFDILSCQKITTVPPVVLKLSQNHSILQIDKYKSLQIFNFFQKIQVVFDY